VDSATTGRSSRSPRRSSASRPEVRSSTRWSRHEGRPYRVLYAFDPQRKALLLLGGDKGGNDRFYEQMVPRAEALWEQYLAERSTKRAEPGLRDGKAPGRAALHAPRRVVRRRRRRLRDVGGPGSSARARPHRPSSRPAAGSSGVGQGLGGDTGSSRRATGTRTRSSRRASSTPQASAALPRTFNVQAGRTWEECEKREA
jgi:hypothetical protein